MTHLLPFPARPDPRAAERVIDFRRVLWACDFSPASVGALRFVLPVAGAYSSEMTAVHVIPATLPPDDPRLAAAPELRHAHLHHDVTVALEREVSRLATPAVTTRIALREGNPAAAIVTLAGELSADLVVMGNGKPGGGRAGPGSLAEAVFGRARCPVLAVPVDAAPTDGPLGTVVCATDFSAYSALALRYAAALASRFGSPLVLLHVVEREAGAGADRAALTADERMRKSFPAAAFARHAEAMVTDGPAAAGIVRVARERGAGLLVMGVHGASTLHAAFFGSTAHEVVRDAPCAVLGVRPRE